MMNQKQFVSEPRALQLEREIVISPVKSTTNDKANVVVRGPMLLFVASFLSKVAIKIPHMRYTMKE